MSLKNLQEISTLVTNYTKKNRFLDDSGDQGGLKYLQLINGLAEKRWSTDEEAATDLYGNDLGNKTFDMLKSRAKERLVNAIFQLDTEKEFKSSYDKAYFLACKNLLSGAILLLKGKLESGENQLRIALKSSSEFGFTDLSIVILRLLRSVYGSTGQIKKFKNYNSELKRNLKILELELSSEELYQELAIESVISVSGNDVFVQKAKDAYNQLLSIVNSADTYTTRINMYRVGLMYYHLSNDFKNSISLATECENYHYSNPHFTRKSRLGEMSLNKLYASLHLRDYENGSRYADDCTKLFNPGTLNSLIFLEYYFLLCLHTGNYSRAGEVYRQVVSHRSFESYPPQNKEKWRIFEAFLMYALPDEGKSELRFNIPRFINEVPIFSKDKAGYNFSIIVAQLILSLRLGDFSLIVDKGEALKLYTARYIRKDKNPRSYYFMKMVQVMIKYDFDPVKTEQIAQKFFVKLQESHLGEQSELETLEVIPYDLLWPQMLDMLRKHANNN